MPIEETTLRDFIVKCLGGTHGPRTVTIVEKKEGNKVITKFKLKTRSGLHTMVVPEKEKAEKLINHFSGSAEKIKLVRIGKNAN